MSSARISRQGVWVWAQALMLALVTLSVLMAQTTWAKSSPCGMLKLQTSTPAHGLSCICGHCDASGSDTDCDMADMAMDGEGVVGDDAYVSSEQSSDAMSSSGSSAPVTAESAPPEIVTVSDERLRGAPDSDPCQCRVSTESDRSARAQIAQDDPIPSQAVEPSAETVDEGAARGFSDQSHTGPAGICSRVSLYVIHSSFLI